MDRPCGGERAAESKGAPFGRISVSEARLWSPYEARAKAARISSPRRSRGLNPRYNAAREFRPSRTSRVRSMSKGCPRGRMTSTARSGSARSRHTPSRRLVGCLFQTSASRKSLPAYRQIWTAKPETARRLAQRIRTVLDVARSKGFRSGENPVTAIRDGKILPKVTARPKHHAAMDWRGVPALYADLRARDAIAAKALMFTCLTRVSHQRGARGDLAGVRPRERGFGRFRRGA